MPRQPLFRWDARTSRYRDARGRFVPRVRVRQTLDVAMDREGAKIIALTDQLRARTITVDAWQVGVRQSLKDSHLYAAAAARGGWAQLAPADILRAGREIGAQYRYLQALARDIASGKVPIDGRLAMRVRLYAQSARATYHATERIEQRDRNSATQERNMRAALDSCATCLDVTARGWVPIGTLPLPGSSDRVCRQNCKCHLEYRAA